MLESFFSLKKEFIKKFSGISCFAFLISSQAIYTVVFRVHYKKVESIETFSGLLYCIIYLDTIEAYSRNSMYKKLQETI